MELAEAVEGARSLGLYELLRQRLQKEILVVAPAVGVEWSATVPPGSTWELLTVRHSITTSAVVANRIPGLRVTDSDGGFVLRIPPSGQVAASSSQGLSFASGIGGWVNLGEMVSPLPSPPILLPSGWIIRSLTSALDVGDQYAASILTVREWSATAMRTALGWLEDHYR